MKSKWVDLSGTDPRLSLWFLSLHHAGVKPVLPEHGGQQTVGVTQRGHDQLSSEKNLVKQAFLPRGKVQTSL